MQDAGGHGWDMKDAEEINPARRPGGAGKMEKEISGRYSCVVHHMDQTGDPLVVCHVFAREDRMTDD